MRGAFERVRKGSVLRLGGDAVAGDPLFEGVEDACQRRWMSSAGGRDTPTCHPSGEVRLSTLLMEIVSRALLVDNAKVFCAGHSLGGALALQLALHARRGAGTSGRGSSRPREERPRSTR